MFKGVLFRKLIYLHSKINKGYNIHLITDKNVEEYIKVIPDSFKGLCPAHQADFINKSLSNLNLDINVLNDI